jgi:hypothetical protein
MGMHCHSWYILFSFITEIIGSPFYVLPEANISLILPWFWPCYMRKNLRKLISLRRQRHRGHELFSCCLASSLSVCSKPEFLSVMDATGSSLEVPQNSFPGVGFLYLASLAVPESFHP